MNVWKHLLEPATLILVGLRCKESLWYSIQYISRCHIFTDWGHITENPELHVLLCHLLPVAAAPPASLWNLLCWLPAAVHSPENAVHPIWYPGVRLRQLDPRWNALCNVCAIWQLLIRRQYAHPLSGLRIRPQSEQRREKTKSSWCNKLNSQFCSWNETAAPRHATSKPFFFFSLCVCVVGRCNSRWGYLNNSWTNYHQISQSRNPT